MENFTFSSCALLIFQQLDESEIKCERVEKSFFFWVNSIGADYAEDILHDGKIMILFSHSTHYISMARSVGRGAAATEKT